MKRTSLLLALLLAIVAGACRDAMPPETTPPDALSVAGTDWRLVSITTGLSVETLEPATVVSLHLDSAALSGRGPCNRYGAAYATSGVTMMVGPIESTKITCRLIDLERRYFDALSHVASYTTDGETLRLYAHGGSVVLNYVKGDPDPIVTPDANVEFRGRRWELVMTEREGVMTPVDDPGPTIVFDSSGDVFGMAGCNPFDARFTADSVGLSITEVSTGDVECPRSELERHYINGLIAARRYRSTDTSLRIVFDGGVLHFARHDGPQQPPPARIVGASWRLRAIVTGVGVEPVRQEQGIFLEFREQNRFEGDGQCSEYDGAYRIDGSSIAMALDRRERFPCPDRALEDRYLELLEKARRYGATDSTLRIVTDGGVTLLFGHDMGDQRLAGLGWRLISLTRRGSSAITPPKDVNIFFGTRGRVEGKAICNTYQAVYRVTGDRIRFRRLSRPTEPCSGDFERDYFDALREPSEFELIEPNKLRISNPSATLLFERF